MTKTHWTFGPSAGNWLYERVVLGIEAEDNIAFTPLYAIAERIVEEGKDSSEQLDIIEGIGHVDLKILKEKKEAKDS